MDRRELDVLIKQTLHDQAETVSMTEARKNRIYQMISDRSKEEYRMKIKGKRKMAAAAVIMCLLGSMAAFGAGKITGYRTGQNVNEPEFASYADMSEASQKAGFSVKAVERFDNGFAFEKAFLLNVDAFEESGQVVDTFPQVSVQYGKDGLQVTLDVEQVRPEYEKSTTGNPVDIPYGDITLTYREDHYKFVPPDYEVTEEDQDAMDSGELYLSYGSSEVEYEDFHFLEWEEGEVRYLLMSYGDGALGQEEMTRMAQQVIDSPQL